MEPQQTIVTKAQGEPVETMRPTPAPTPRPSETLVGAAVRTQLRAILDDGQLTEKKAERMLAIVKESLPLLRVVMGATGTCAANTGVVASVQCILGAVPVDEWSDAWGPVGIGGSIHKIRTLAKIALNRAKAKVIEAVEGAIRDDEGASLDPALRVKIGLLLEQPYTPPTAKSLERLLSAVVQLLRAVGPASDRVKRGPQVPHITAGPISYSDYGITNPTPMSASMNSFSWGSNPGYDAPLPPGSDDEDQADGDSGPALVTSPPIETFGAKIIREIMAMAPVLMTAQRNTPENMVLAICAAEREGMPKLAAKLRRTMGLDKPEEQETPKPSFPFLSHALRPVPAEPGAGVGVLPEGFGGMTEVSPVASSEVVDLSPQEAGVP